MSVDFVEWLNSCPGLSNCRPVEVQIGTDKFQGAIGENRHQYVPTERAVTEGVVQVGEIDLSYRLYLLGKLPSAYQGNKAFTWKHELPYDPRVAQSVGDWYLACHSGEITRENEKYSPCGPMFMLFEWAVPTYGPYKNQRIDHFAFRPYIRIPMTVTMLPEGTDVS